MDGEQFETEPKQESGDPLPSHSNILQSFRVRRFVCSCDEMDRVLLDYGRNFLLPVGIFLWTVLLIFY